ncbi:MAG TPA: tRNA uridine-5-carboxymethylaminomethyl(34) synthesis enzyme MnmG [Desulfomonilia bacterium]|nr:tRNA uridine-5-carboxymethylaminomethyl(34) synthesis enzyme MnmG [Desulfomonilia bacterium]
METFDVIVVGGGHAGVEAALAAHRLGVEVALFTLNMDTVGRMPCSPSIGGLAKSHLVKEVDALGGIMAEVADQTAIAYRLLNTKKGPAVRSTRTQNDRRLYEAAVKKRVEESGIHVRQGRIDAVEVVDGRVSGVRDRFGSLFNARAVVITAGTFLSGLIHIGQMRQKAGRSGEEASYELAGCLAGMGFSMGRLKTGTPPRLHRDTIDLAGLQRQDPDDGCMPLGFASSGTRLPQVPCHLTRTSPKTHEIIRDNICLSPLYSGAITGTPARYCPSLEDKVMRFGDRGGHQVILEPEGIDTREVYASGLGNSLPPELQWELVRSVPGLERAEIIRPAYAIEYEYVHPTELLRTLETKRIQGLYLAGQVNGTSGYEEAAGQGIMAGINAALKLKGEAPFILDRSQAYIAVMIDDLVTRGTSEPYRMFTSRAEYRLLLRETNALFRLSGEALSLGLISGERFDRVHALAGEIEALRRHLAATTVIVPETLPEFAPTRGSDQERISLERLLKRPEATLAGFRSHGLIPETALLAEIEAEVEVKYEGYIDRQLKEITRLRDLDRMRIPAGLEYSSIHGLSNELRRRLEGIRPETLGQAALMEGMTPAGLQAVQLAIRMRKGPEGA